MDAFLNLVGILLIIASVVVSVLFNVYGLVIFPVVFALGCINIGLGKIIELLQEIKANNLR
jgi:hypothetical protein